MSNPNQSNATASQRPGHPIEVVAHLAAEYRLTLQQLKAATRIAPSRWDPSGTLGELSALAEFLEGEDRDVERLLYQGPVLDLCCGDGDVALFLASQGCTVDAADWPSSNMNQMSGVRRLREVLDLRVDLVELDLNGSFRLPRPHYNTVFFLDALHRLQHPFAVLEALSRSCTYCVLTGRVTRYATDRHTDISSWPVAYLVDEEGMHHDATSYWLFTPACLRRALQRTNWQICAMGTGSVSESGPGNDRVYCLLKSSSRPVEYLRGVHLPEPGGWRWTERRFSLRIWHTPGGQTVFQLPVFVPRETVEKLGKVTVTVNANGETLQGLILRKPGEYRLSIPDAFFGQGYARVDIELDKALPADERDNRERGLVIQNPNPRSLS